MARLIQFSQRTAPSGIPTRNSMLNTGRSGVSAP